MFNLQGIEETIGRKACSCLTKHACSVGKQIPQNNKIFKGFQTIFVNFAKLN